MEEKDSLFKKFFYTGVGLTVSTKEKVEKKIQELVDKNKITEQEGKKIIDEFVADFDVKRDDIEKEFKKFVQKTTEAMKLAKKKDVEDLNTRIDEIESKIESLGKS
ncbi:MAG: phasin family protein [Bacteroidota bacterium]|nr:phasin family protein [Bacteroidota bacterium]